MNSNNNNVLDDKFEVSGKRLATTSTSAAVRRLRRKITLMIAIPVAVSLAALLLFVWPGYLRKAKAPESGVFDPITTPVVTAGLDTLGRTDVTTSFTERLDTVINDVRLAIFIPHNATAELTIGAPDINDSSIILAAQAADIRADNGKILGAFVLKGEPKAWGLSKKGYCAIIDGVITVGVSDNSPLFEEATDKGGYFFRQYPLVDNGQLVDNEPKNKTMRKALCARGGQTFMVVSLTDESFHDFAQALVDLGVDNAIYLVGGYAASGWLRDEDGQVTGFAAITQHGVYKNESYILWRVSIP